ncbi:MAG: Ig-like domain-containing protein [Bacteroidota bacterium]
MYATKTNYTKRGQPVDRLLCSWLIPTRNLFLFTFLFGGLSFSVFGEGSKEVLPRNTDRVHLLLNAGNYNNFGRYNGTVDQRLHIHISNPSTEQVFLGFSAPVNSGHHPCAGTTVDTYYRIKDPNGNVVFPVAGSPNGQLLNTTNANLTSLAQVMNGPSQISGTGGYNAVVFDPAGLTAGDYYVEFSRNSSTPSLGDLSAIEFFDITVATKTATPTAINGRVFATNWAFQAPSISCGGDPVYSWFDRPFNGLFYVYSEDGFVSKIDFDSSGFQPAAFNVFFNANGADNTGDLVTDRKSVVGTGARDALHKIFVNEPDITAYPSGSLGTINGEPEYNSCVGGDACFELTVTEAGQINILIDLDSASGPGLYDPNTTDRLLAFAVNPAPNESAPYIRCIPWDKLDGLGNMVTENIAYTAYIVYGQGVYHLPIFDAEFMLNGFKTTTIRPIPPEGSPKEVYYDDSLIPFLPGNGAVKSGQNGCPAPCHTWTNFDYGNLNTINTWYFAREELKFENDAPNCVLLSEDDRRNTPFETPIDIDVLANDNFTDLDTAQLAVTMVTPQNGTPQIDLATGIITYTPNTNFSGLDTFQYEICHNILPQRSLCDRSIVYITVDEEREINCGDGQDNDNDGAIDCADSDCLPVVPTGIIRKN